VEGASLIAPIRIVAKTVIKAEGV